MPRRKKTVQNKTKVNKYQYLPNGKYSWLKLALFGLTFALIGYFIFRIFAAPTPPTVYLVSTNGNYVYGTSKTFTVDVYENSGTTTVNAVQANFTYPTSLVNFVSIATGSTISSPFTTIAQATGGSGSVNIGVGLAGGATAVSGQKIVARVTFTTGTTGGAVNMAFSAGTALVSNTTNQVILGSLSATGPATFQVDTTPPSVSFSTPTNGSTVALATTVPITVSATDSQSSISNVKLSIDGVLKATLTISPYTYSWSTSGLSLGSHTISATSTDTIGNTSTATSISVTVADQTGPTTSLTAPSAGSIQKGTVSISAAATDNPTGGAGMAKVEFYADGTLIGTDTTLPYSINWDTTTASNASHSLTVKAYDAATPANSTTSSAVSVTVDNSPPTIPGSFRSTGNTISSISLAWNASTDNLAVANYRLQRGSTVIATLGPTNLTYNDSGLLTGTSYSYSLVAIDTAGNSSTAASLTTSTASLAGDLNGDGHVDGLDISIVLSNYNTTFSGADANGDGTVNILDISYILTRWAP